MRKKPEEMQSRVYRFVTENRLIEQGDRIVVGVSGGADSVCLLLLLTKMREAFALEIFPVHVEHGIRGREAQEDRAFVQKLCVNLGIDCRIFSYDVPAYAVEHKMTIEEAGRYLRYRAFTQVAEEIGGNAKIAVAHHKMDNAETILLHLFRGSGLDGLAGIAPKNGKVIRPLADMTRDEIDQYLAVCGQAYREDSTNAMEVYARNRIRNVILPEAEKLYTRVAEHIDRTGREMAQLRDYMEQETEKGYARVCLHTDEEGAYIELSTEALQKEHPALQGRIIRIACANLAGGLKDISRAHIDALAELSGKQVGKQLQLPYNITAKRTYAGIRLQKNSGHGVGPKHSQNTGVKEIAISTEIVSVVEGFGDLYEEFLKNGMKNEKIQKKFMFDTYTKWFDYDKISGYVEVRTRQEKDYIIVNSRGDKKTLKRFFIDAKVPAEQREQIPLIACGEHVLWIYGYRTTQGAYITKDTKRILKVTVHMGGTNERTY
ncbi:MAG: tRNA lysidine(34) synthetase TilS [Lachnospiraceae bacterium]|nr:tRNA lysidine(34) synthetase TilS [Lachnospiraceae bacterium]